jgi:hypothetical protein
MARYTCTDCHQPIPNGLGVLRGNGHELLAWHRGCFTLHRIAVEGLTRAA